MLFDENMPPVAAGGKSGLVPPTAAPTGTSYLADDSTFKAIANASAATDAQAAAGTSTTTFVSPATAALAAAKIANPRAPRQALAFDGTAPCAVANLPTFGTGDFSVFGLVTFADFSISRVVISSATNGFALRVNISGLIEAVKVNSAITNTSTSALTAAKAVWIGYVRESGVGTFYINAVSAGSAADVSDYSVACTIVGTGSNSVSSIRSLPVYNRALSAAEVLALYEQGAPSAADYVSGGAGQTVTPTASSSGTFSSGPSVTASTGVGTGGAGGGFLTYYGLTSLWTIGRKFRISLTVNSVSGGTVTVKEAASGATVGSFSTTGAKSYEYTATQTAQGVYFEIGNGVAVDFSSLSIKALGLLCAPEANAPGNGYQWRDMSGNMADITVPVSGVAWALPDTRPNRVRGTLTWAGTHEVKSLLGQRVFPNGAVRTLITTKATAASSGVGLVLASTNSTIVVAANAFTTTKKLHTIAAPLLAGTADADADLLADPDSANFTGSVAIEAHYSITEGT